MILLTEVRKIRFHIVTIFSTLIIFFSILTIFIMHFLNYRGMVQLSSLMIEQVAHGVGGTVSGITEHQEQFVKTSRGIITHSQDVNADNQSLLATVFNALKYNPLLSRVSIGTTNGNFLVAYDVTMQKIENFHFSPARPLPDNVKYALRIVEGSKVERWEYKDDELNTVTSESSPILSEDLRLNPWFENVARWPKFNWVTNEMGFTASAPIWDPEQNFIGVFSAEILYKELYNLISHQRIGASGQVFLLNERGGILAPPVSSALVTEAFTFHKQIKRPGFILAQNDEPYIFHISTFPLDMHARWLLMIAVPFNDFFATFESAEEKAILFSITALVLCTFLIILASRFLSRPLVGLTDQVNAIRNFDFKEPPPIKTKIWEIVILNKSIQLMRTALRSFERYVPKQIIRTLLEQGNEITVGGERRELTVLFSDIENFTTKTEHMKIDQLAPALTEYFNIFSKIITETGGTIDKYIGDSIMAFWNAPKEITDHAEKACIAALRCTKTTKDTDNIFLKAKTRFGVHTGEVVVGNFGSIERLNYTALGDTVNISSRLQSMNKEYNTSILISESVSQKLPLRFLIRPLDSVSVKGRQKRITIFELVGVTEGEPELKATPEEIDLCQNFTKAHDLFHEGKTAEAKEIFLKILEKFPSDHPTQQYLTRLS